ncbi:MAG TPA: HEAT repeat domain-containing protein [Gemmatimonadales bacterium]|nr:HEAT repeat domain-containing protein [Gemmatimonadales bacterium]
MSKGLRAFQMYLPNNPVYQRAEQAIQQAFLPIWSSTRQVGLSVVETDLVWEEQVVYHQPNKNESLAWMLYKDGMRFLMLRPGVEDEEMVRFLQLVSRARLLPNDAADDLLTLLWEQDFQAIEYQFAEIISDSLTVMDPQAADMALRQDPTMVQEEVKTDAADKLSAGLDLDDFDSTLYFLDEQETALLKREVDAEYTRDERRAALDALLDIFELQPATMVREEVLGIFEVLFPNLLNRGEFRSVAGLLREFRAVSQRVTVLDQQLRDRLGSFQARLSEPEILSQLLQSLEEAEALPTDDDVGEVLGELHAEGLETMLTFLPSLTRPAIRGILESSVDRLATAHTDVVLAILSRDDSPALAGGASMCGRLGLQVAVPLLDRLVTHRDASVRLATVEALSQIGSAGALTALERALDDADRTIRLAAVTTIAAKGYRAALRRLEAAVIGKGPRELERAEKRQFFEAYAVVAGAAALPVLSNILEPRGFLRKKETSETRTCAAYAIGRLQSPAARAVLERIQQDKDLPVRNAALRALRDWPA